MNALKRVIHFILVGTCVLSISVFYGCGASSLGPYQPLLPTVESEAKFSSRFQLDEEPNFFYDLYGKEIIEGSELNSYTDRKEFDQNGKLAVGWAGNSIAFDSRRNWTRTIIAEESFSRQTHRVYYRRPPTLQTGYPVSKPIYFIQKRI